MTGTTSKLGQRFEQRACQFLLTKGLTLVVKNFRCRQGEVDLVMLDDDCLVFVEVRYRKTNRYANALHSVDRHKQRKLINTAATFLARRQKYCDHVIRFDVIAFDVTRAEQCTLQWLRDAFRP